MLGASDGSGLRAGDRVGRYELLSVIGRGGFALVWLARMRASRGFEKLVAVKAIRPELAVDASFEKMFVDEARIAAAIDHPNVARVFDFGDENGVLYLVMEYIRGEPLTVLTRAASKRGTPLPFHIAAAIVADTCAGLHAAHELTSGGHPLGVIHRDVSPQNILVDESGVPKLVDFGIAKAMGRLSADTAEGLHKGKVRYMAPEQIVPRTAVDRRVDVWASGAVLYELIEGRPIHEGPNDVARLHALVAGHPIPPFRPEVPPEIAGVCFRALAHDPSQRWSSALEMREALLDALARVGRRVSSTDVQAYCQSLLPTLKQERDTMIQGAIAEAESRTASGSPAPVPDAALVDPSDGTLRMAVTQDERASITPSASRSRSWRWLPVVGVAAMAAIALGARQAKSDRDAGTASSVAPSPSAPPIAAREPAPVVSESPAAAVVTAIDASVTVLEAPPPAKRAAVPPSKTTRPAHASSVARPSPHPTTRSKIDDEIQ